MQLVALLIFAAITFVLGGYASTRVRQVKDFTIAGRSLPFFLSVACVFMGWIGTDAVRLFSSTSSSTHFPATAAASLGTATSLLLFAFFFRPAFYQRQLGTIGDYFKIRYSRTVEWITSISLTGSYVGLMAAQFLALGIVIEAFIPDVMLHQAVLLGAVIVTSYTLFGGMWAISLTNLLQSIVILGGLLVVAALMGRAGDGSEFALHTNPRETVGLMIPSSPSGWLTSLVTFITVALGFIPQQDAFQRITSAKNERTALMGTLAGTVAYSCMAFVLILIAAAGQNLLDSSHSPSPAGTTALLQPGLISLLLNELPPVGRVLLTGAILAAILSTASGTLLASASLLTENVLFPFTRNIAPSERVWIARYVLLAFAVVTTSLAMAAKGSPSDTLVAGVRTALVVAFVPLCCGIYWRRATTQGALCSIVLASSVWIAAESFHEQIPWPSLRSVPTHFLGLAAAVLGMLVGSLTPSIIPGPPEQGVSDPAGE
ncbi:sodium:solute symporter family transporter [Schlesneria sp. DSM 10557]|uniref:sodium:solute symporter family transporter n=1 Tax=Schlesneria sp. DSM 10557 TaxID=3044399 RepID=UPI0035A175DB